jgi:hypothetical protein
MYEARTKLMQRPGISLVLALVLAGTAGGIWRIWAEAEYTGLTYCPWNAQSTAPPLLVGLLLSLASATVMGWTQRTKGSLRRSAVLGLMTGGLAALVVLVVAFAFGASLHCTD